MVALEERRRSYLLPEERKRPKIGETFLVLWAAYDAVGLKRSKEHVSQNMGVRLALPLAPAAASTGHDKI